MLSYRHAFHAGNHADVLKHLVLVQILHYLGQKDKPFWIIDTHAGAGLYALDAGFATKLSEYQTGIGPVWEKTAGQGAAAEIPAAVNAYLETVRQLNPDGTLKAYPGSPWFAHQYLRTCRSGQDDRLHLFERHSTESEILRGNFHSAGRQVTVNAGDGFQGIRALLPPAPRRGLILIDPSYETSDDYRAVLNALKEGLRRFATGTFMLWYPLLARPESRRLPEKLQALPDVAWLDVTLSIREPLGNFGMPGSGLFIINPPWTLEKTLRDTLPWLVDTLKVDQNAGFTLQSRNL